ncbi:MAG: cytochrome C biosynthesis protein [Novosphingobium sp.]|nr:cytochrome C biosynthesis protein [Novosphingobium sp.]
MSYAFAILLAALCFAAMAFVFRLPRKTWALIAAALALGLAGYATQASPDLKGAPGKTAAIEPEEGWAVVEMRKELVGSNDRSTSPLLITADALARQGEYADSAALLRGIVHDNPRDTEAWLALGNVLTFQADGLMTPASQYAYRQADTLSPDSAGPAFFIGWAAIRQGRLIEGRELWAQKLKAMPEGAPGREELARRLANFDQVLRKLVEQADAKRH